jgi:hypothetical protein
MASAGNTELPARLSDTQKGILCLMVICGETYEWWTAASITREYNFIRGTGEVSKRTAMRSVQRLEKRDLVEISRYDATVKDFESRLHQAHKIELSRKGKSAGQEICRRITDGRYSLSVIPSSVVDYRLD